MSGIRAWLRPWASAALMGGLMLVLSAATDPQAARAGCTPLPPLIDCPGPAPAGAPVITVTAPTGVGARTATLTGTINPEGDVTSYHWVYADASGDYLGDATPTEMLPASSSPQPVSTPIAGLRPGVPYTVTLYASNSQGDASAEAPSAFTTTSHPILTVTVSDRSIKIAGPFEVTVKVRGAYDPYGSVHVYIAKSPYRRWVDAGAAGPGTRGTLTLSPCPPSYQQDGGCPWLDRNFKVRAQMGASHSSAQLVYVYPSFTFTTEREDDNSSPVLDLTYSALVHRTSSGYPNQLVYFYESPTRNGPFTRVGASRLHHLRQYDSEELIARDRISNPGAVYTSACIRHQLFRDMGRNFVVSQCGASQLP